jgi:hypothetical protein
MKNEFDPGLLGGLDEPVRRYFAHALASGATVVPAMRLAMAGRIKVGLWMPFVAEWEGDGRYFRWSATAGPFGLPVLRVLDQFEDGSGSMDVRLRPGIKLVHADDEDTTRSGAGRAAAEAMWTPAGLLPQHDVSWRADGDDVVVASWEVPPERPELRIQIDRDGAVRTICVMRWQGRRGYVPMGGDVLEDRRFGDVTIPSRISVGWWYGTPQYKPFFEATITAAQPVAKRRRSAKHPAQ